MSPSLRATITRYGRIILLHDDTIDRAIPPDAVLKVENHLGIGRFGEGELMKPDALRGRQLHIDAEAIQPHGVITGAYLLRRSAEQRIDARSGIAQVAACQFHLADGRHQRDIAEVADTCPAQVHLSKPDNRRVRDMIAGAPVPPLTVIRRAHLYEPERNVRPDEYVPMIARPDVRIDILCQIL